MKARTPQSLRLICAAFASALLLLALILWQGLRRGTAVRVGIPRSVSAYGAGMLLQTPSAQYKTVLGSTPQALLAALNSGELDAALLPYTLARQAEGAEIRAVLGYETPVLLGRERIGVLRDLAGSTLTLDEGLRSSRTENMLRALLREAEVRCEIAYGGPEDAVLYCCDIDTAAALLAKREDLDICFSFSRAWQREAGEWPPAGLCLAVRQDFLQRAGSDYAAFERALESAVRYGGDKRKKTAAMAAAAGLADSEELADRLYPYCDFCYLTGSEMNAALNALTK